jgi:hypothetical protein
MNCGCDRSGCKTINSAATRQGDSRLNRHDSNKVPLEPAPRLWIEQGHPFSTTEDSHAGKTIRDWSCCVYLDGGNCPRAVTRTGAYPVGTERFDLVRDHYVIEGVADVETDRRERL